MKTLLTLCLLFTFGFSFGATLPTARAQTIPPIDLNGHVWSSNIGWISLSCRTGGATGGNICGTSNYGVTINADRTVTGYAWSSNIGWIRFGGLSAFPPDGGDTQVLRDNVEVTGTYPNLSLRGFARACAGTASGPGLCGNMANNPDAGGWDGWISFDGLTHNVNLNATSNMGSGDYAWGGTVVGWLDWFTRVFFTPVSTTLTGTGCEVAPAASTCTGQLTWSMPSDITSPSLYNLRSSSNFSASRTGTNQSVTLSLGTTNFVLRTGTTELGARLPLAATCAAGTTASGGVCVAPPPTISLEPNRTFVRAGLSTKIRVTITGLVDGSCRLYGPGTTSMNVYTATTDFITPTMEGTSRYRLECTGSFGTAEASAAIEVLPNTTES